MPAVKRKRSTSTSKKKVKDEAQVTRIAKKVCLKLAETRSPINSRGSYALAIADTVYAWNLNYFVAEGDTAYQITGEKIYLKNIHIKGRFQWNGYATFGAIYNDTVDVRMLIIKTKAALTNTAASVTTSEIFRQDGGSSAVDLACQGHVDLHKVKLIADKTFHFDARDMVRTAGVANQTKSFDIIAPINKTEYYDGDSSGYLKGGNYYAIFCYSSIDGFPNQVYVDGTWSLQIKDM